VGCQDLTESEAGSFRQVVSVRAESGNTLLRLSANGLILIGGQPLANYDVLCVRVRKISDQPVRALILTDQDAAHTGCNAKFIEEHAQIVAQENVKRNLTAENAAVDLTLLPTFTYDKEYRLTLGGVEAQLFHFGNAHTNRDTVVYFPSLKVVAVGGPLRLDSEPRLFCRGETWCNGDRCWRRY